MTAQTGAKKSSVSGRGQRTSVSAESIFSKPLNEKQGEVLAGISKRQAAGDDSSIDYSDIPALSDEQLKRFSAPQGARGRPPG
jgi:hypothetical protein